jgi:hypothetical protein
LHIEFPSKFQAFDIWIVHNKECKCLHTRVAQILCARSLCQINFFMVAPRIFRWFLDFWKICAPLLYNTCWLGWILLAARKISSKQSRCLSAVVQYIRGVCKSCEFYRDACQCILLKIYCSLFRFSTNSLIM